MGLKMKGKERVWWYITKLFLLQIAFAGIISVAVGYLTSIQLIWATIILLVVVLAIAYSKIDDRFCNINDKLQHIDKDKNNLDQALGFYGHSYINPEEIVSKRIESKNIVGGDLYIAGCIKIVRKGNTPYLYINDEDDYEDGTVIKISELRQILNELKQVNLIKSEEVTEEEFVLKEIAIREQRIKKLEEHKPDRWEDDIKRLEQEIDELNEWIKDEFNKWGG